MLHASGWIGDLADKALATDVTIALENSQHHYVALATMRPDFLMVARGAAYRLNQMFLEHAGFVTAAAANGIAPAPTT